MQATGAEVNEPGSLLQNIVHYIITEQDMTRLDREESSVIFDSRRRKDENSIIKQAMDMSCVNQEAIIPSIIGTSPNHLSLFDNMCFEDPLFATPALPPVLAPFKGISTVNMSSSANSKQQTTKSPQSSPSSSSSSSSPNITSKRKSSSSSSSSSSAPSPKRKRLISKCTHCIRASNKIVSLENEMVTMGHAMDAMVTEMKIMKNMLSEIKENKENNNRSYNNNNNNNTHNNKKFHYFNNQRDNRRWNNRY